MILGSGTLQRVAFSPPVRKLQEAVIAMPHLRHMIDMKPVRLAGHYLDIFATMAIPPERRHKIVIVGLVGKEDAFHLLRRAPNDRFEAGMLDNVTGHVDNGEPFLDTVHREMREETEIPLASLMKEHAATLYDMGHFGWLMHLRTPDGPEPSIVYGKMFVAKVPELEARHIRLDPTEHTEVVTLASSQIQPNMSQMSVFDRLFFNANLPKLGTGLNIRA